ncbi:MAG: methionyl-tRNA formyltransferase [Candidatus Nitrotoga sp.]
MKIIFAGTPEFAATALQALLAHHHNVVAVLTQPDRPAGRGMHSAASPVKQLALSHGLPVLQPTSLKSSGIQQILCDYAAEVMVVAAYGLILPQTVLSLPRLGCLNIHASLLPRWRGAAPIQRAILAGDEETGITIMQMDAGLDTGDILLKKRCSITAQDTAQTLHDKLAGLGAGAIIEALQHLSGDKLSPIIQDNKLATYAPKLNKAEALINWSAPATQVCRAVRAYCPFPVAHTYFGSTPIKIWQATIHLADAQADLGNQSEIYKPGTILSIDQHGILVACGQGAICLEVLQRPNARALPVADFVRGFALRSGDAFANSH